MHAVGKQRRGERVSRVALVCNAVVFERERLRAIDDAARWQTERLRHEGKFLVECSALARMSCVRVSRRTLNQLSAAGAVQPQLVVRAAWVVAQVDVLEPRGFGRIDSRPLDALRRRRR